MIERLIPINAGKAIQSARYEARRREIVELERQVDAQGRNLLRAYWWWGWDIHGRSGLGRPGRNVGAP